MLYLIVGTEPGTRVKQRTAVLSSYTGEIIALDDMSASLPDLEQYLYPSLFSIQTPIIHGKYLLKEYEKEVTKELLQKLVRSPSIFILEEQSIGAPIVAMVKKEGGVVHAEKATASLKKENTIFSVTIALTGQTKKDRWMAYRTAVLLHPPEALIGILYWKLKDLIGSTAASSKMRYKKLYTALMKAHAKAWKEGTPLELAIEKIVLSL